MKAAASLLLGISCLALAADNHYWKAGRVLDSQFANAYFETGSTTFSQASAKVSGSSTSLVTGHMVTSSGSATVAARGSQQTHTQHMELRSTQLLILGDEYAYVIEDRVERGVGESTLSDGLGRAIRNGKHGCRYVVNDWISYAHEGGNKLYVNDVDGKTCKLDIVRQERLKPQEILALENPVAASTVQASEAPPPSVAASASDVAIKSTPESADITIDGKYMGSTPSNIPLAAGEHQVEIAKSGFKVWKRDVTLVSGGQITLDVTLDKGAVSH